MLNPLSSPPPLITQEEHDVATSSTPADFDRNPPILRFHDEQVEVTLEPRDGFQGYEGRVAGQLWVTESAVSFLPPNGAGWTLPFPSLTLHALTPSSPDSPAHVYCQVDESDSGANGHADGEEDEYTPMREIRIFLPEAKLQPLFAALSQCSALHLSLLPNGEPSSFFGFGDMDDGPDDEWEGEEEEEEDEQDGEEDQGGREAGQGTGDQMDRFLGLVDWGNVQRPAEWTEGEFDDAEE